MSGSQVATSYRNHSLSQAASSLIGRIPELLHRLRELESEEVKLNERARQLLEQLEKEETVPPPDPTVSTPVSKVRTRAMDTRVRSTPPHVDLRNIETPVKTFLLMESFALPMSVRSKRRGRIFFGGDGTEFGERR